MHSSSRSSERIAALTSAGRSQTRSCSRQRRQSRLDQPQRTASWRLLPCLPHGGPPSHSESYGTCTRRNTKTHQTSGGRAACKQRARVSGVIRCVPLCLKESSKRHLKYAHQANLISASQQRRVGELGDRKSGDYKSACKQLLLVTGRMEWWCAAAVSRTMPPKGLRSQLFMGCVTMRVGTLLLSERRCSCVRLRF